MFDGTRILTRMCVPTDAPSSNYCELPSAVEEHAVLVEGV